ncbi:LOB domain-containing protein 6-like [Phalaenopsis equestris]|uniref:LOB domain-containing protein 6-like n=1 Tax=Phalaenopsis equestris TaxID=78828 RepID=UPI0009E25668|nr:LOB domain-containing protein 6-like [Phalaenopsis equestris]
MEPLALISAGQAAGANGGAGNGSQTVSTPCAGCKFLRRKCQPDCVFAPYFPPDEPQKFANVHRVFGASNVAKILNELQPFQREDAVNSLAYEADMRLRDPVYGCVGIISVLQHQLRQLQLDLSRARTELCRYQQLLVPVGQTQQQQQQQQRLGGMRGYGAGMEVGGYDVGMMTAAAAAAFGGHFGRFSGAAGVDDRQSTLGSSS